MTQAPWEQRHGVDGVVDAWLKSHSVRQCLSADIRPQGQDASSQPMLPELSPALRKSLAARGITELFSHQADAIAAAQRGRHVVIATPTASDKSLCFHLPVLQALAEDPSASALFLYPTKALSRDQEHALRQVITDAQLGVTATVYDGDTPGDARRLARERCRIVLTNPDMLHAGILPNHTKWVSTFQGLRYV
ncbi:MAG TPA: DEAD/DEAH box helicase, partial [Polyangiaceae bacterium]|nr:DEAD/DEAH box helicase [Polyangiaceae bacterium]